jgi:ketosteroid isomerase-like protein
MKRGGRIAGWWLALGLGACAHAKIPETNIDDTPENRAVLALVEDYQEAVEALDADAVLALVSPDFYEDNGNTDSSDDYGYEGLREALRESFDRTEAMQLILRVNAIEVEDDEAFAELQYEFRAHNDYPSGMKWDTGTDRTRLRLRRSPDGEWRIVSGI